MGRLVSIKEGEWMGAWVRKRSNQFNTPTQQRIEAVRCGRQAFAKRVDVTNCNSQSHDDAAGGLAIDGDVKVHLHSGVTCSGQIVMSW